MTNEEVLRRLGEKRALVKTIIKRRDKLIGHLYRHNEFIINIMEGVVEGKRGRGRPRLQYVKQIQRDVGVESYQEMKRLSENREVWSRRIAANQSSD